MLIINLTQQKSRYNFAHQFDNNSQSIKFYTDFNKFFDNENNIVQVKIEDVESGLCDLFTIDNETIVEQNGLLSFVWVLNSNATAFKTIKVQAQIKNSDGTLLYQSRTITIFLGESVNAEEELPSQYPNAYQELKSQVDLLMELAREHGWIEEE